MARGKICLKRYLLHRRQQRGQSVAGKNICGGRTVRAKALTLARIMGLILCAMPYHIKPETRLNAAPLLGIPHIFLTPRVEANKV